MRWLRILGEFRKYTSKLSKANPKIPHTKAAEDFAMHYRIDHQNETPFSPRTLLRKEKRFRTEGILGLVNLYGNTRNFAEWSPEAKSWIWQKYLNINKPCATWCYTELKKESKTKGWKIPSRGTVLRYLKSIPPETRIYFREGEKAWREQFMPSVLRDYEGINPGRIYVADNAQINVAVRSPSGKPVFPWFVSFMDMRTRKILAWELCETPNSTHINIVLKRSIERYGLPTDIIIDNGRDYTSYHFSGKTRRFRFIQNEQELTGIYRLLGITPHYCIPANARSKNIERFFWTEEMHFQMAFPTYRGNCPANRPEGVDKRIKDGKVLDWNEFKSCLSDYISRYNLEHEHTGHGMYGRSPDQVWNEFFIRNEQRRVSPVSLRLLMMKSRMIKVGRFGIRLFRTFYHSDTLMDHQQKHVVCRYDPENLEEVHVYSEKDEFLCTAQKVHRTAWNDESAYREIKSLEKRRRKALKEERLAAERIAQVEFGYSKREVSAPREPEPPPKIVRLVRTPFDGTNKKIEEEKVKRENAAAVSANGERGSCSDMVKRLARRRAEKEEEEERRKKEDERRRFARLTINNRVVDDDVYYDERF